ncbi:putative nucleotide-diphospho-sugar transferase [Falsirhodobacter halotolerans]|uniref:putative nucleotide-diphospho-sugar transferase n=1 Tax=Falsirhodobacter halotolerans TaxID=1146892 RepID=UPI001FCF8F1E|nr:putative nucleotide-diphospho-sugar transferase [Falsirhodobacter halotolerans]MCJ8140440.1 putative nucleotide-diphospho-sugar transferase [Falsirhodobacter halotolerans]
MEGCGIVFGATGRKYRKLAQRAARNVRQVMPHIPIDLFTDEPLDDAVFDRVVLLERGSYRPKMEALLRSRFERTIYLDCDVVVVNDITDLFVLLERADIVGAHEQYGSAPITLQKVRLDIPPAFRQINSGVFGIRKSEATDAFVRQWRDDFIDLNLKVDQPLLRELLWQTDLKVFILPSEYNQMHFPFVRVASDRMMATRVLHIPRMHDNERYAEPPDQPFNPADFLPAGARDRFNAMLATDQTLPGHVAEARALRGDALRRIPLIRRFAGNLRRLMS